MNQPPKAGQSRDGPETMSDGEFFHFGAPSLRPENIGVRGPDVHSFIKTIDNAISGRAPVGTDSAGKPDGEEIDPGNATNAAC
jgi:hypothetical protein